MIADPSGFMKSIWSSRPSWFDRTKRIFPFSPGKAARRRRGGGHETRSPTSQPSEIALQILPPCSSGPKASAAPERPQLSFPGWRRRRPEASATDASYVETRDGRVDASHPGHRARRRARRPAPLHRLRHRDPAGLRRGRTSPTSTSRSASASRASTRSRAGSTPRCTARAAGRCASTRATRPRRRRTSATATCSSTARPGCRWRSTCRRSSAATPTTRCCLGEVGRTGVAIDSIDDMRTAFDQIPLDKVSTSMTINAPAAILLLLYELVGEEQGVPVRAAARHGPERHPQGVRGARELHLPARGRDAPDDRHLRLLPQAHPEVEHDLDLRLPHAREGLLGGAGGRVHALERDRLRAGRDRRRPRGRRLRAPDRVLLQRPQQRLPGGREVPRRAQDVGRDHARPLRRAEPALA